MSTDFQHNTLDSLTKLFAYYRQLGERSMAQLEDEQLFHLPAPDGNSIAILVKHLWGNMQSRFTDFLNTDGEKDWRNRDGEFENDIRTREELLVKWTEGWQTLEKALKDLRPEDLDKTVYIRNQGHTVVEALHRQLGHYAYHIGQIVQLARMQKGSEWESLSIPKGESKAFNKEKFEKKKSRGHFTDET